MNCTACGQPNADGVSNCMRCGAPMGFTNYQQPNAGNYQQPNYQQPNYQQPNYNYPPQPQRRQLNPDFGFLMLALIPLLHQLMWWVTNSLLHLNYRLSVVVSIIFMLAEFTIMIAFTKNTTYRILIGVAGFIILVLRIFNFI